MGEETMDDDKAFQQLMQRLANVLARALVGYNFLVNLSPCPLYYYIILISFILTINNK